MVGAGLGGSATAYFLQQHFGPQVQLDVYEAASVGGRLATVTVNKQQYESRGASIHALSLHMQDFVKILGETGRPRGLDTLGVCAWGGGEGFCQPTLALQACGDPLCCCALLSLGERKGWGCHHQGVLVELVLGVVHKLFPVCPSRQQQLCETPHDVAGNPCLGSLIPDAPP